MHHRWGRQRMPCLGLIGAGLMAGGLILLFACVPGWAWAALAGLVLIGAGYVLLQLAQGGR